VSTHDHDLKNTSRVSIGVSDGQESGRLIDPCMSLIRGFFFLPSRRRCRISRSWITPASSSSSSATVELVNFSFLFSSPSMSFRLLVPGYREIWPLMRAPGRFEI